MNCQPPGETSGGQVCYYCAQIHMWSDVPPRQRYLVDKCVTTSVKLPTGHMEPPGWSFRSGWHLVRLQVRLTFGCFPIAFLICDYKSNSAKVVPWCGNTSDWWWKDMCTLAWTENSLDSISLHLVQEYVIRWCR